MFVSVVPGSAGSTMILTRNEQTRSLLLSIQLPSMTSFRRSTTKTSRKRQRKRRKRRRSTRKKSMRRSSIMRSQTRKIIALGAHQRRRARATRGTHPRLRRWLHHLLHLSSLMHLRLSPMIPAMKEMITITSPYQATVKYYPT